MPSSLSVNYNINLKSLKLTALLLLSPLFFFAQSLTGLWIGALTNDSNSVRKDQSFEIVLTEYRGKVYGYSRSEFIVNDTLYYIVKRVKGTIDGDMCEVKDDEIISYNFPKRLDKGVKVTSTFYRNKQDSIWYLAGKWKTSQTKNYYSLTGKIDLKEEKDLTVSKIFPHLEELGLSNDVAFYKDRKKETAPVAMKTVESENKKLETFLKAEQQPIIKDAESVSAEPDTKKVAVITVPVISPLIYTSAEPKKPEAIAVPTKTDAVFVTAELKQEPERQKTIIKTEQQTTIKEPVAVSPNPDTKNVVITTVPVTTTQVIYTSTKPQKPEAIAVPTRTDVVVVKAEPKQETERQKTIIKTQPQTTIKEPIVASTKPDTKSVAVTTVPVTSTLITKTTTAPVTTITTSEIKKPAADAIHMTSLMEERKSEFSQVVNFKSDSLELALYDNGEIDGDTVSVFMNGEVLLAKQGLKASAIKKTIYITPGKDDEFTLVLYAENLGKYPPNTGLLVVHDGDDVYNVRFSADFQKNAGVVFRRKK